MPGAELPACVFCGKPIGPDEEASGRPPMAAHAACADAALADDVHWDQISTASGGEPEAEQPSGQPAVRSGGCLVTAMVATACILLLLMS